MSRFKTFFLVSGILLVSTATHAQKEYTPEDTEVWKPVPTFDKIGLLLTPAYITVMHNGILVQHHTEIKGRIKFIGLPHYEPHGKEPIHLQDHGNAVSFRNIWVREL